MKELEVTMCYNLFTEALFKQVTTIKIEEVFSLFCKGSPFLLLLLLSWGDYNVFGVHRMRNIYGFNLQLTIT